jgi:hypothetical protein
MPDMPEVISKPLILRNMERAARLRHLFDLKGLLDDLNSTKNLATIGVDYGVIRNKADEDHIRTHWLNETNQGYWKPQPVEKILRKGLIKVVEALRDDDLPLDVYWLCSSRVVTDPVQATVTVNAQQITFMIHTPNPNVPIPANLVDEYRMWWVGEENSTVALRPVKRGAP